MCSLYKGKVVGKRVKRLMSMLLVCVLVGGAMSVGGITANAADEPIPISTPQELYAIRANLSGNYILVNDIDLSGYANWMPIGAVRSQPFTGSFNGDGFVIRNMTVHVEWPSDIDHVGGLFGSVKGALIRSVGLVNSSVTVKTEFPDSFAYAGGIAGFVDDSNIVLCYNKGSVMAIGPNARAGGIVGYTYQPSDCQVLLSYNTGDVTAIGVGVADASAGGIVGAIQSDYTVIMQCYNAGTVRVEASGQVFAGGIVGSSGGMIVNCFNHGIISTTVTTPTQVLVGGIAAYNRYMATCYNTGGILVNTSSYTYTGGLAGYTGYRATDSYCLNNIPRLFGASSGTTTNTRILIEADMISQSSYTGFNFDTVWKMPARGGYPVLQALPINIMEDVVLSYENYIQAHLDFIATSGYSSVKDSGGYAVLLKDHVIDNGTATTNQLWDLVMKIGDWIQFDFSQANDYDFILAQLLMNNETYSMFAESMENQMLSEIGDILRIVSAAADLSEFEMKGIADAIQNAKHFSDITKNNAVKQLNQHISVTKTINVLSTVYDMADIAFDNVLEVMCYVAAGKAYLNTCDEFKEVLVAAVVVILGYEMNYNLDGSIFEGVALEEAVLRFFDDMENYKADSAKAVAGEVVSALNQTAASYGGIAAKEYINSNIYVKAIYAGWGMGVDLANKLTKADQMAYSTRMLVKLGRFTMLMQETMDLFEGQLKSSATYKNARLFDQAFRIYKNLQLFSLDTAIRYYTILADGWINSNAYEIAANQLTATKVNYQSLYCHPSSVRYADTAQAVKINCPVDVYVYDTSNVLIGSIVDNIPNDLGSGLTYFVAGDVKEIYFPDEQKYNIKLVATDNGTFSYTVLSYDSQQETIRAIFYDLPIQTDDELIGSIKTGYTVNEYALNFDGTIIIPYISYGSDTTPVVNIMVNVEGGGFVSGGDSYKKGDSVLLIADPLEGCSFEGWYEDGEKLSESSLLYNFAAKDNRTITAQFSTLTVPKFEYTLTVIDGSGSGEYEASAIVPITADAPPSGKVFDAWTAASGSFADANSASTTFTMPAEAVTVTATYKNAPATTYTLTVIDGSGSGDYEAGASIPIIADAPPSGKVFDTWTAASGSFADANNASTTFSMPAEAVTVTATYKNAPTTTYTLTVIDGSGSGDYEAGASIPIIADAPPSGKVFDAWTAPNGSVADVNSASTTFTMPADAVTITATYKDVPATTYTLTVNDGSGSGEYPAGASVPIVAAEPPSGKVFDVWTAASGSFASANSASTAFTMPAEAVTVTATYKNAPMSPTDKTALNARLNAIGNIQKGKYTDDSWNAFQSALSAARSVASNENATQDQVNSALNALNAAYANLREKKFIFTTKYEATVWNWIMFFLLFGWIWMWF